MIHICDCKRIVITNEVIFVKSHRMQLWHLFFINLGNVGQLYLGRDATILKEAEQLEGLCICGEVRLLRYLVWTVR